MTDQAVAGEAAPSLLSDTAPASAITAPAGATAAVPASPVGEPGKPGEAGKDSKADEKPKTGAPEKYDAFKIPEGVELDQAAMEAFLPVAKELNLTQDQAQKLIDLQSKLATANAQEQQQAWDKMQEEWVSAARSDSEIGGVHFKDNVALAAKAVNAFGSAEFKAALDATGTGNHPEFIRVFAKIGKAIAEDKLHIGNSEAPATPKTLAERLFPGMSKPQGA